MLLAVRAVSSQTRLGVDSAHIPAKVTLKLLKYVDAVVILSADRLRRVYHAVTAAPRKVQLREEFLLVELMNGRHEVKDRR